MKDLKATLAGTGVFAALMFINGGDVSASLSISQSELPGHQFSSLTQTASTPTVQNIAQSAESAESVNSLNLDEPVDALQAFRKLLCSVDDGKTVYFVWQGKVFSRRPGEPDQHIFNVQGMSARACGSLTSETGTSGFRQVSREVMIYQDPETNEMLETWENPWTGQTNTVVTVANDPVNTSPMWADTTGSRLQFQTFGNTDTVFLTTTIPLFYPNPLGGEHQAYIGGQYHAVEMFNFAASRADLLADSNQDLAEVAVSWSRISPWLPWMEMGDRPGELVFHAASTRLSSWQELPEPLKGQIAEDYALYQNPPALDDDRPNQTTWTNFLEYLEQQ